MPVEDMLATPTLTSKDMPYVQFDRVTVEDPLKTKEDGVMRFKDVDLAIVTVPGDTKANTKHKAETFFANMKQEALNGRIHADWLRIWKAQYDNFKEGKEIPLEGTPILGWKLISGAQQEDLVRMNVRTVEALANLSDDGLRHVGMGAQQLKRRAQAWIEQNASHETAAIKISTLAQENESLKSEMEVMRKQLKDLEAAVKKGAKA